MATLVDTNVLLRLLQPEHPQYAIASMALAGLRRQESDLCIARQNLVEFWAVATRPVAENGLGTVKRDNDQLIKTMDKTQTSAVKKDNDQLIKTMDKTQTSAVKKDNDQSVKARD